MAAASVTVTVVEPRNLTRREAAAYVGLPVGRFPMSCPVQAFEVAPGRVVYDRRDLDRWIDQVKSGGQDQDRAAILGKLG